MARIWGLDCSHNYTTDDKKGFARPRTTKEHNIGCNTD